MITLPLALALLRSILPELKKKYPISSMNIFGSVARGDQRPDSDLDILVEFSGPIGWEFIDLADEIEAVAGVSVDLVSSNGIKTSYREQIRKDLVRV